MHVCARMSDGMCVYMRISECCVCLKKNCNTKMHRTTLVSLTSVLQLASRKNMKRDFNLYYLECFFLLNVFFGIFENTVTTRSQKDERNSNFLALSRGSTCLDSFMPCP